MTDKVKFTIVNVGTLSMNKFWGEAERLHEVSATCTLLQAGERRLLVDPSPEPERLERLLFDHAGLRPGAVDAIFVTHFHADHRFGLQLFKGKTWLMASDGLLEWRQVSSQEGPLIDLFLPAEGRLPKGIRLFPSPGHTPAHHSLAAETRWGELIVTGDAAMTAEFFEAEEGYHNSVDFEQAAETIRRIKESAHLVIPGHGGLIPNL